MSKKNSFVRLSVLALALFATLFVVTVSTVSPTAQVTLPTLMQLPSVTPALQTAAPIPTDANTAYKAPAPIPDTALVEAAVSDIVIAAETGETNDSQVEPEHVVVYAEDNTEGNTDAEGMYALPTVDDGTSAVVSDITDTLNEMADAGTGFTVSAATDAINRVPTNSDSPLTSANIASPVELPPGMSMGQTAAVQITPVAPQLYPGSIVTLEGWITSVYGDPPPESNRPAIHIALLKDTNGNNLARLNISHVEAMRYFGQTVQVEGTVEPGLSTFGTHEALPIIDVTLVRGTEATTETVSPGSYPWVNILCKFAGNNTVPFPNSHYNNLFSSSYPGLLHYWREISYNQIDIDGTQTIFTWFALPHPRDYYLTGELLNTNSIATDCINSASGTVNFNNYAGVNLFFNDTVGCCAWGGSSYVNNVMRRTTWIPTNYQIQMTIAHEMGHAWGLPHSSGPANNPPTEFLGVYVSEWDVMSAGRGTCAIYIDALIGCPATGTISYYLKILGWLPNTRIQTVANGTEATVTLERLQQLQNAAVKAMIEIPVGNSTRQFYTVEVREQSGYDQNVPGQAVIIHYVDLDIEGNTGPALVVDADTNNVNPNDAGARWQLGESFYDAARNIEITVMSKSGSDYTVRVRNNVSLPVANLAMDLTANTASYTPGNNITYTMTVSNSGPAQATGVNASLTLPTATGVSFVSAGSGCAHSGGVVTCTLGTINSGANASRTVTIATTTSTLSNPLEATAGVSSSQLDTTPSNNSDTLAINRVPVANLELEFTTDVTAYTPGYSIAYTMKITNSGPDTATGVTAVFTMPTNPGISLWQWGNASNCTLNSGVVTCTITSINANQSVYPYVIILTDWMDTTGPITASATISATQLDQNTANNSAEVTVQEAALDADLELDLTADASTYQGGDYFNYSLTVKNLGPETATNIVVTFNLPTNTGAAYFNASTGCSHANGVVTCTISAIGVGNQAVRVVVLTTTAATTGTLNANASVTAKQNDPVPGNNSDSLAITNSSGVDLGIQLIANPNPYASGNTITYTMTISNSGNLQATGVVAAFNLPSAAGVSFVSAGSGCTHASGVVTCTIGTLNSGASTGRMVTIATTISTTTTLQSSAGVSASQGDMNTANNNTSINVPRTTAIDLGLSLSSTTTAYISGNQVSYVASFNNAGPAQATGVTLTINLPTAIGVSFDLASTGCSHASGVITCTIGTLNSGASATRAFRINTTASTTSTLQTTASITATQTDTNTANNTASLNVPRNTTVNLGLTLSSTPTAYTAGNQINYTASFNNAGPNPASGVTLTINLPTATGVSFASASTGCSHASGVITCTIGTLNNGANATRTFTINTTASTTTALTTTASIAATQTDSNTANNSASLTVNRQSTDTNIGIGLSANPTSYTPGNQVVYTLTISNSGANQATGVVASFNRPTNTGVSFVSAGSGCTHSGTTVTCNIGTLNAGANTTRTVTLATTLNTITTLQASAAVTMTQTDTNTANNTASLNVSRISNNFILGAVYVNAAPYSNTQNTTTATKTADEPTPTCGSNVGKTVWYRFTAPAPALYTFSTAGSNFDTVLAVYQGSHTSLTQVGCNDDSNFTPQSRVTINTAAGNVFYVMIGGYNDVGGTLAFGITAAAPPLAPTIVPLAPELATPTPIPPFLLVPPVLTNIDGGGVDWTKSGGWTTTAAANFTGTNGLGWEITGNPAGNFPLQWNHQFNLAGIANPRLSFVYQLAASGSTARVDVRQPGNSWQVLATLPPAADWDTAVLDLSAYSGQTIEIRFLWIANGMAAHQWRLDNVYLFSSPTSTMPSNPGELVLPGVIVAPPELPSMDEPTPTPGVELVPVNPG